MIEGLVKILIFDKMADFQKKISVFHENFSLQSGLKNRNYCPKPYSFDHYLKNISE